MDKKQHWEQVYANKSPQQVSWFQVRPAISLDLISRSGAAKDDPVIDVGAGASVLVDHLLARGHTDLTLLDISAKALAVTQSRLGQDADSIDFVEADITVWEPQRKYRVWHDRAAFHFLVEADDRERYVATLKQGLTPDGQVIIGTFSTEGPKRCSDLDVVQYDEPGISTVLGPEFELIEKVGEDHVTPWGSQQHFFWSRLRRRS